LGGSSSSSAAADEGTFFHDVCSDLLSLDLDVGAVAGKTSPCGRFVVDDDAQTHIQTSIDAARAIVKDAPICGFENKVGISCAWVSYVLHARFAAQRLSADRYKAVARALEEPAIAEKLNAALRGTADVVAIHEDGSIDVVDFKFGAGVWVDVEQNAQLRLYALMTLCEMIPPTGVNMSGTVRIHVVQPRHYKAESLGAVRTETITLGELLHWFVRVAETAMSIVEDDEQPFESGDHCRFCAAKAACPKLREDALETARVVFSDVEKFEVNRQHKPPVGSLSDAAIARILDAADAVELWLKAIREEAYARATRGVYLPGWKMVHKYGHRAWIDVEKLKLVCAAKKIDPFEPPKPPKIASPAQLEKKLGKTLVESLATKPVTGTVLAPESDNRPAVNAASVFEAIEGSQQQ
jgi:hypothetical protein